MRINNPKVKKIRYLLLYDLKITRINKTNSLNCIKIKIYFYWKINIYTYNYLSIL